MSDDLSRDPLRIEEVLAGRRNPADVDPEALAEARRSEECFQQGVVPRTLDAVVGTVAGRVRFFRPAFAAALAATAVAVVVVINLSGPGGDPDSVLQRETLTEDYVGVRGGPTVDLRVHREGQVLRWAPGAVLRGGDALRLIPHGQGYGWILVFAMDAAGEIQVVVPWDGAMSLRLDADGAPLPGSLVLDEIPGPETLIVFFSNEPLDAADAVALVRADPAGAAGSRSFRDDAVVLVRVPYVKEAQ